jgi:catechol 2,3-dioxygenase-like lactoylglutathione lyase family enzyme
MADVPQLFRVMVQVSDLDRATGFYSELLGIPGRRVGGGRAYFDCGPVILALLDPQKPPHVGPDDLYYSVPDLEKVHARAQKLGCLSKLVVHDQSAGDLVTRPWGERSFYAEDPFGNGLCFVDETTLFKGRRE